MTDPTTSQDAMKAAPSQNEWVDRCHFSRTGFALWVRGEHNTQYCTCDPRPRPSMGGTPTARMAKAAGVFQS